MASSSKGRVRISARNAFRKAASDVRSHNIGRRPNVTMVKKKVPSGCQRRRYCMGLDNTRVSEVREYVAKMLRQGATYGKGPRRDTTSSTRRFARVRQLTSVLRSTHFTRSDHAAERAA